MKNYLSLLAILLTATCATLPGAFAAISSSVDKPQDSWRLSLKDPPAYAKRALVIGIDHYEMARNLEFCGKDAQHFAEMLKTKFGFTDVVLMTDEPGTPENLKPTHSHINFQLRALKDGIVANQTEVVLFYSGHGVRGPNAQAGDADWLVPSDGDPDDIPGTCVNYTDFENGLNTKQPARALLIVDAGRYLKGGKGLGGSGFGSAPNMLGPQIAELLSCQPTEVSHSGEPGDFQESVFTHYLIAGLEGDDQAVAEGTNTVTFDSLKLYLQGAVSAYVRHHFDGAVQMPDGRATLGSMVLARREGVFVKPDDPVPSTSQTKTNPTDGVETTAIPASEHAADSPAVDKPRDLSAVARSGPLAGKQIYKNSFALLIGIDTYPNLPRKKWLDYASADARDMRDILIKSYGFQPGRVKLLLNAQATKAGIEAALSDLADSAAVGPEDRILVFFSGHGQTVPTGAGGDQGFLLPYDANVDLSHLKNAGPFLRTCIRMDDVWGILDSSPAKHCLVMADACYSGLLANTKSLDSLKPGVIAAMAAMRASEVMTAGTKGQEAAEFPQFGHGGFTYNLLEQLKSRAAEPGTVFTTSDLYSQVSKGVQNLTNGKQFPILGKHNAEGDFLFISTSPRSVPDP